MTVVPDCSSAVDVAPDKQVTTARANLVIWGGRAPCRNVMACFEGSMD